MSDLKREDLRVMVPIDYRGNSPREEARPISDAEFDAIARSEGYTDQAQAMAWEATARQLGRVVDEWERLGVKVWEDCQCGGHLVPAPCPDADQYTGGSCTVDHRQTCPTCDGSGKVPAEGVQQAANGWWIAPDRVERR